MHMSVNAWSGVRGFVRSAFGKGTTWFGLIFLVVWSVFVAGCGGDDTNVTPTPVDSGTDAKKDTGVDTGLDRVVPPDATPDGDATTTDGDGGPKTDGDATTTDGDGG